MEQHISSTIYYKHGINQSQTDVNELIGELRTAVTALVALMNRCFEAITNNVYRKSSSIYDDR